MALSARIQMPVKNDTQLTLADLPSRLADRFPRPAAINRCLENEIQELSSQQFYEKVRDLSLALTEAGLAPGDRVGLISDSRPEWTIADLAVISAGGVTVPIYPTQSADQVEYILKQTEAVLAIVSNPTQAQKVRGVRQGLPALKGVVLMEGDRHIDGLTVTPFDELVARGTALVAADPTADVRYREQAAAIPREALATIVYTSGTTGEPKGVMLSHANIMSNVLASAEVLMAYPEDVALTFLPLSHVYERMVVYRYLWTGMTICYAESLTTVARDLARVRPTIMAAVPRVFEKVHSAILEKIAEGPAIRRALFEWGVGVGGRCARAKLDGRTPGLADRLQLPLADVLVLKKVRARLGGRFRFIASGSAPLGRHVAEFFFALGVTIVEGYGLTETSPVLSTNRLDRVKIGTVGLALPGVDLRIGDYGEILARGPNVMSGYYKRPDLSAEVLKDGWFYTGDIGEIDADGFLTITDRRKDIIVTSGGKKVAPQPLENTLKAEPLVAEAVIIGEQRRFPAVLIVPAFGALDAKARELGLADLAREQLLTHPRIQALYQEALDRLNAKLAQFERIKRFALLPNEFTMERGELTPTMKVRRKVVEDRWKPVIDSLYEVRAATA